MSKMITIIGAVVIIAIVAVAAWFLVFNKDGTLTLDTLDDEDDCAKYFVLMDTDATDKEYKLEKGMTVYKNSTIKSISTAPIQWNDSEVIENSVVAQCTIDDEDYLFRMDFTKAEISGSIVIGDGIIIILENVKKGFGITISMMEDILPDLYVGEWSIVSAHTGYYKDGEPQYQEADLTGTILLEKYSDEYYVMTYNDEEIYCVYDLGMVYGSQIANDSTVAFLTGMDDDVTISYLSDDYSATVLKLKRDTPSPIPNEPPALPDGVDIPKPDEFIPAVGTTMDAVIAKKYVGTEAMDMSGLNFKFEMLQKEDNMLFYKSLSDGYNFNFVSIRVSIDTWISISQFADDFLIDMVYFDDGVVYTSSYSDANADEYALWNVVYGNKDNIKPIANLEGKTYSGTETSMKYESSGIYEEPMTVPITLSFDYQDGNVLIMTTTSHDGTATWGTDMHLVGPGVGPGLYKFTVESEITIGDVPYHGYYNGTMTGDFKTINVVGTLIGDDGISVIFVQEYELYQ